MHRFTSTEYEGLGHSIESINGLHSNVDRELFWTFLKRNAHSEGDCAISLGRYHIVDA